MKNNGIIAKIFIIKKKNKHHCPKKLCVGTQRAVSVIQDCTNEFKNTPAPTYEVEAGRENEYYVVKL